MKVKTELVQVEDFVRKEQASTVSSGPRARLRDNPNVQLGTTARDRTAEKAEAAPESKKTSGPALKKAEPATKPGEPATKPGEPATKPGETTKAEPALPGDAFQATPPSGA
jgi:hypothetical protein